MAQEFPLTDELTAVYARLSGVLLSEENTVTAAGVVTSLAAETIPDSVGAGVTLIDERGRKRTSHATDPIVERADALQYELDEGPCLAAWRQREVVRIDDVTTDMRWPAWAEAVTALGLGLRSALSAPLVVQDESLGAIKVYARDPYAFDTRSEHLLSMFAGPAGVLIANVQRFEAARQLGEQLKEALRTRDVIGMAKGMLIAREGVDETQAFAMLVAVSQREHRKLNEVAADLVAAAVRRRR
jgi:GAF domain-containing protein